MTSLVTEYAPGGRDAAAAHFAARLSFETDCSDVHAVMSAGEADFVLLDVRRRAGYEKAHVPGAISLPHREMDAARMGEWAAGTLFVVYCAGPHCNAADQAALKLARLGVPVKLMIGGLWGWEGEGYAIAHGAEPGSVLPPLAA